MTSLAQQRVAGILYLFTMTALFFAQLYARGPAGFVLTARNVAAAQRLFRVGIISDLATFAGVVVLVVALYVLLGPINRTAAILAAFWRLAECLVLLIITLNDFAALLLLGLADSWRLLDVEQLQSLAQMLFSFRISGLHLLIAFLALESAVFTYLWLKSGYMERNRHVQSAPSSAR